MTPTNVVSMDFETKEATQDYLKIYKRGSTTLHTDAEMLSMFKTTEKNFVGVSVYFNEVCNFAESRNSREIKHLLRRISDCLEV